MYKKETVHVSLGSTSNAVTAHLLNLQGLAATSDDDPCDAHVTHAVHDECYVPRVIMVDEPQRFGYQSRVASPPSSETVSTWDGTVEVQETQGSTNEKSVVASEVHEAAAALAHSAHSRYRIPSPMRQSSVIKADSSGRHMLWDDEEEEETEQEQLDRKERERLRWMNETVGPLEKQMDDAWALQNDSPTELSWMDYWMPPLPPTHSYSAPLPYSHPAGGVVDTWDSYVNGQSSGGIMAEWRQDILLDQFRRLLEACDAIQGFTVVTEGWGIHAGLATALLQEMQEEVRSAGRFLVHMAEPYESQAKQQDKDQEVSMWQPAHVERVRRNLQTGLALHGLASNAHVSLPLLLDSQTTQSTLFAKSATVAMALETTTLPYRLSVTDSEKSSIGLNGYYDGSGRSRQDSYSTANCLSFGEFAAYLRLSSQHVLLEMDACVINPESKSLSHLLQEGTSIERQRMMRLGGRDAQVGRPRDVSPGGWLQDGSRQGGILRSLSPQSDSLSDRQLHRHFSLSTTFRPHDSDTSISHHVTSFMESMGIRYRPEVAMGTVLGQSVASLTQGGYGAGSYWKTLLGKEAQPVLSVLGNTTRVYPYLNSISNKMKDSLSHKYGGYRNRDIASGVLPEDEDCAEAQEYCFDVREAYLPPDGSGLVVDTEGSFFDTNMD